MPPKRVISFPLSGNIQVDKNFGPLLSSMQMLDVSIANTH